MLGLVSKSWIAVINPETVNVGVHLSFNKSKHISPVYPILTSAHELKKKKREKCMRPGTDLDVDVWMADTRNELHVRRAHGIVVGEFDV